MTSTVKTFRLGQRSAPRWEGTQRRAPPVLKAHRLKDVAGRLAERRADLKLTVGESEAVVKEVLDIVEDILSSGDDVILHGFGKFTCKDLGRRTYRNPSTGDTIVKDTNVRVSFAPSAALKRSVTEGVTSSPKTL